MQIIFKLLFFSVISLTEKRLHGGGGMTIVLEAENCKILTNIYVDTSAMNDRFYPRLSIN
jgi:hypothetical protein